MQIYVACAWKPQFSYWTNPHTHIRSYKHPTKKNHPKSTKIRIKTFSHTAYRIAAPEHALAAFQLSVINLTFCVSLFVCWGDRFYFRLPILTVTTNSIETHLFQVITEQKNQKKRQFESQSTKNAESCVDRAVHHTHIHA